MQKPIKSILVALALGASLNLLAAKAQLTGGSQAQFAGGARPARELTYDIEPLYQEVRRMVRTYYPQATAHRLGNKIHFEYNTRIFIIHEALMTGDWQDPGEERGPRRGGVHGDIVIEAGPYAGQATVPQSFDKRYFTEYLTAPYSTRLDAHLHVLIKTPRNVPAGFLRDLNELLGNFDKLVTKAPPG